MPYPSHYLDDKGKAIGRPLMIQGENLGFSKSFDFVIGIGTQTFSKSELSKFIKNEYPTHRLVMFIP
jgi:hypothetical protein